MRAPARRRPRSDEKLKGVTEEELVTLAGKVAYIISPEHKDYMTSAGPRKLRSDATPCPRGLHVQEVEEWLREAIRAGQVSAAKEGDYPRYAWARVAGQVYEARLSNSGLGQYKGYPILDDEAPRWLS